MKAVELLIISVGKEFLVQIVQTVVWYWRNLHIHFLLTLIVCSHMFYLFIQDLFQVTFVNAKVQSNHVTGKCSRNTKPYLLEGLFSLGLWAMSYWNEPFLHLTHKANDSPSIVAMTSDTVVIRCQVSIG